MLRALQRWPRGAGRPTTPLAYVILKPGVEVSRADLVAHCREHLAAYKAPRAVQFVASVPITSSGKIMRRMLKDVDDGSFKVN